MAELLREWEQTPPASVEHGIAQLKRLEARSRELRYARRDVDLYLRELWAEERERRVARPHCGAELEHEEDT